MTQHHLGFHMKGNVEWRWFLTITMLSLISNKNVHSLSTLSPLREWRRARAVETALALDASRYHFQILYVDDNNAHGRIAEGLLARISEYNDALNILFPASTTVITNRESRSPDWLRNVPEEAVAVCNSLDLCSTRSRAEGFPFHVSYLDQYDLVIALNDDIRSLLLRSLETEADRNFYARRCRLLSEFLALSLDDDEISDSTSSETSVLRMLDSDLLSRAQPYVRFLQEAGSKSLGGVVGTIGSDVFAAAPNSKEPRLILSSSNAPKLNTKRRLESVNREGVKEVEGEGLQDSSLSAVTWPVSEAAMILASAGITRFCLGTMNDSFAADFQYLLETYFCRPEHLKLSWEEADAKLRHSTISGYFSVEERKARFEDHCARLKERLI